MQLICFAPLGRAKQPASLLQRLVAHVKASGQASAIHKLLDDFPSAAWIRLEVAERSFEARQIMSRNSLTVLDVSTDFCHYQWLRTSKTPRPDTGELSWVQQSGGSVFARWPEAAT